MIRQSDEQYARDVFDKHAPKPIVRLDKNKKYYVKRIGMASPKITQGKIYIAEYENTWRNTWNWVIKNTDIPGKKTQPSLSGGNSSFWEIIGPVKEITTEPPTEEKTMSAETPANPELKSTSQGRMINKRCASTYSDRAVIEFIKDEREKSDLLALELGTDSKYFIEKNKAFNENIAVLTLEIESRV